ncbi:MAG: hypothetical protein KBD76_14490 [Bacteriovorax sp.]|jgi:hypothetical protein|nr:hypothetical protein [Bacteriovorax sp.]
MKLLLFLLIFLFFSCQRQANKKLSDSEVENILAHEWTYAYQIKDVKFDGQIISRPPGISQLIFSLDLPEEGGLHLKGHCVYYQVPYKNIPGIVSILEMKKERKCPDSSLREPWVEINQVKNLRVSLENFHLIFQFSKNEKLVTWNFPLPNLNNGVLHEKFQAPREKKLYPGMSFLRMSEESITNQNNRYLGRLSDRFARGSSIRCHQVNKNCVDVGDNRCDDCAYGWYEVVDYQCPQGGSKFCGQNHCGEKNEPACPRGTKVVHSEESGICQTDLTPSRNADHILVCL